MTPQIWIALAVANFVTAVAPGQNVALVSASTARIGGKAGCITVFAILIADLLWCLLAISLAVGARGISPNFLLGVQVVSGLLLVVFGLKMVKEASRKSAQSLCHTKRSSAKLLVHGFGIGFANPLTLVFFLSLFPAFLPVQSLAPDLGIVTFYGSAIVVSGAVALVPYILAGLALSKAGLTKALTLVSGGALASIGGIVLVQSVI